MPTYGQAIFMLNINEHLGPSKDIYKNVHGSFIQLFPNLK